MTLLDSLKRCTAVVAATGDIEATKPRRPRDATGNPSSLEQAVQTPEYRHLLEDRLCRGAFTNLNGK